jgi:hypothetical protein
MVNPTHVLPSPHEAISTVIVARLSDDSSTRVCCVAVRIFDYDVLSANLWIARAASESAIGTTDVIAALGKPSRASVIAHCSSDPVARAV